MRFNNSIKMLTLSIVASTIFVGCGGSDGDATTAVSTQTGTFVDAPVEGLKYITATQSGFTDTNGKYKFVNGENIEFFLGNLSLGQSAAQTLMTPYTLGSSDITTPSTITKNIAMLLQNMDQNRSNTDKLIIAVGLRDYNFSDLNLSSGTLESDVTDLLASADIQSNIDVDNSLITLTEATTALEDYIAEESIQYDLKFTQEYLIGKTFYTVYDWRENISDSSNWTLVKEQFDGTNHIFNEYYTTSSTYGTDEVEAYEIIDGVIHVTVSDTESYTQEISAIDTDKITLVSDDFNSIEYLYFDEAKAKAKIDELIASNMAEDYFNLNGTSLEFIAASTYGSNEYGLKAYYNEYLRFITKTKTATGFDVVSIARHWDANQTETETYTLRKEGSTFIANWELEENGELVTGSSIYSVKDNVITEHITYSSNSESGELDEFDIFLSKEKVSSIAGISVNNNVYKHTVIDEYSEGDNDFESNSYLPTSCNTADLNTPVWGWTVDNLHFAENGRIKVKDDAPTDGGVLLDEKAHSWKIVDGVLQVRSFDRYDLRMNNNTCEHRLVGQLAYRYTGVTQTEASQILSILGLDLDL